MEKLKKDGIGSLARTLKNQMANESASPLVLDFGTLGPQMELTTNSFPVPIPPDSYKVCRQLTLGAKDAKLTTTKAGDGKHPHSTPCTGGNTHSGEDGAHTHDVIIPEKMRSIKPGDMVLVAWVGSDAVIIDIVLEGTEI